MNGNKIGLFVVIITILVGCKSEGGELFNCELTKPSITSVNISAATCGNNDGAFEIIASGTGTLSYKIGTILTQNNVFENISAGVYLVEVIDENNCTTQNEVTVGLVSTDLSGNVIVGDNSGCGTNNGTLTVTGLGGDGSYEYSIDGITFQNSEQFNGLQGGNYEVVVKDGTGCSVKQNAKVLHGTSFVNEVKSIINTNCAVSGCHVSNTQRQDFTKLSIIQSNAASIKTRTANKSMPKNGSLTQEEIDLIACWIDDGALNN